MILINLIYALGNKLKKKNIINNKSNNNSNKINFKINKD